MDKEKIIVGFLGFGNIGAPTYKLLTERFGGRFHVKSALVHDLSRDWGAPDGLLTDKPEQILNDPDIDIVCEFMGGVEPAWRFVSQALQNGKSVVTSNKAMLAAHWSELAAAAAQSGAGLYFEAAVAAAIPLLRSIRGSLQANEITGALGIVNGTTNYILDQMQTKGLSYASALSQAQEKGYAEPDPTADVSGYDAQNKLSIILSLAMHTHVKVEDVFAEGIQNINMTDIQCGQEMGFTLKLLAIGKKDGNQIEARVHPTFIPSAHPLASVHDSFNAVFLKADAAGDLMFYGRGAGQYPTASALVSDILNAASTPKGQHDALTAEATVQKHILINEDWACEYFLRLNLADKPGMMAKAAGILGRCDVSLAQIIQRDYGQEYASVVFLTHRALESNMKKAIALLNEELKGSCTLENLIRVERDI